MIENMGDKAAAKDTMKKADLDAFFGASLSRF